MEMIPAKTIVQKTKDSGWFGTDYNMNIYKGCPHGCLYCDSRSECYGVEDFDRVRAKDNAIALVEHELASKRKKGVIGTGSMSDPYNPFEEKYRLTRGVLQAAAMNGFGVAIYTKSPLVTRDIDVLLSIQKHSPVIVLMTVTTPSDDLSSKIEPHVAVSSQRLEALKRLSAAGLFTGILMMPILPFIEDEAKSIESLIQMGYEVGVKAIYPGFGVTLRQNQRDWFLSHIDQVMPGMKAKYIHAFGEAYHCQSPKQKELQVLLKQQCSSYGILYKMNDIITAYQAGYDSQQLSFF